MALSEPTVKSTARLVAHKDHVACTAALRIHNPMVYIVRPQRDLYHYMNWDYILHRAIQLFQFTEDF